VTRMTARHEVCTSEELPVRHDDSGCATREPGAAVHVHGDARGTHTPREPVGRGAEHNRVDRRKVVAASTADAHGEGVDGNLGRARARGPEPEGAGEIRP